MSCAVPMPAAPADTATLVAALVEAFQRDPLAAWIYPDPAERRLRHENLFSAAIANAFENGIVDSIADGPAVALWRWLDKPGDSWQAPAGAGTSVQTLFDRLKETAPKEPHWRLDFIGASISGTGAGAALLNYRLPKLDGDAALWTGNPRNLRFYGRHGFVPGQHIAVAGAEAWWLLRGANDVRNHNAAVPQVAGA